MNLTHASLAQLRCRILETGTGGRQAAQSGAGGQHDGAPPKLAVVLCHGYGAPGDDLVPLADEIARAIPRGGVGIRFVFPEAPLALGPTGAGEGRAWWPIDLERFVAIQQAGPAAIAEARKHEPEGLREARRLLLGALDALARQTKLPMSKIVVGGFSQGAMLAIDVALRLEEAPAGLVVLSGSLISETEWKKRAPARRGLRVVLSHGTHDPLLPFANAEALRALLSDAGLSVDFIPFPGAHTIPAEALPHVAQLIQTAAG